MQPSADLWQKVPGYSDDEVPDAEKRLAVADQGYPHEDII